jgi:integrase
METLEVWREQTLLPDHPDALIFSANGSGEDPLFPDTVSRKFRQIRDELGLSQEVTLKNLRHFSGTELMGSFGPVVAAGRLGHKRASTTADYYAAYRDPMDSAAAEHIENLIFGDQQTS